jgi:glycerate kinase
MDRQSLMGKIPGRILQTGQLRKIPVIGIAGMVEDEKLLKEAGFQNVYATKPKGMSIAEAMKKKVAIKNIKSVIQSVMK